MKNTKSNSNDINLSFHTLFKACQDTCLWFWRSDFFPTTPQEKCTALRYIEAHGTQDQFIQARKLRSIFKKQN
jgi:hypothetical protein